MFLWIVLPFSVTLFLCGKGIACIGEERYGRFKGLTYYDCFLHYDVTPNVLYFVGPVNFNTDQYFRKALQNHNIDTIVAASPGGNSKAGYKIADIVRNQSLSTYIPYGIDCSSMCAMIYFAGANRKSDGLVGLHGPVLKKDKHVFSERIKILTPKMRQKVDQSRRRYLAQAIKFGIPDFINKYLYQNEIIFLSRNETKLTETKNSAWLDGQSNEINRWLYFIETGRITYSFSKNKINSPTYVKKIQRLLNEVGCDAGVIDGKYGPKTARAAFEFREKKNLAVTWRHIEFLNELTSAKKGDCK